MRPLHAQVLTVCSRPRALIYAALLAEPGRAWSVSDLADVLPGVSVEGVRATLHLLMGERLMEQVRHSRRLTLRLNDEGRSTITEITRRWTAAEPFADQEEQDQPEKQP